MSQPASLLYLHRDRFFTLPDTYGQGINVRLQAADSDGQGGVEPHRVEDAHSSFNLDGIVHVYCEHAGPYFGERRLVASFKDLLVFCGRRGPEWRVVYPLQDEEEQHDDSRQQRQLQI